MKNSIFSATNTRWCCCISNKSGVIIGTSFGITFCSAVVIFTVIVLIVEAINNEEYSVDEYYNKKVNIALTTGLIFAFITIILNISLLCGIYFFNHLLMIPWLIISLSFIIFSLPVGIFSTIGAFNSELSDIRMASESLGSSVASEKRHTNFYPVLIWLVLTPFETYFWNVVFCVYKDTRNMNLQYLGFKKGASKLDRNISIDQKNGVPNYSRQESSTQPIEV